MVSFLGEWALVMVMVGVAAYVLAARYSYQTRGHLSDLRETASFDLLIRSRRPLEPD